MKTLLTFFFAFLSSKAGLTKMRTLKSVGSKTRLVTATDGNIWRYR